MRELDVATIIDFLDTKVFVPELLRTVIYIALEILLVLIVAKSLFKLGDLLIDRFFAEKEQYNRYIKQRYKTLKFVLKSALRYLIYFLVIIMILEIMNIPTTSIIAGAGVVGLAIGFGAQSLVRDIITGFFILFEKQFVVGDYIAVAGIDGIVEEIGLRVTKVKSFDGELHIIPNGNIEQVTNYSTKSRRVLVDAPVDYETNIDEAIKVLEELAQEMKQEYDEIVEGPTVMGVEKLADSSINIRVMTKVEPMESWQFARVLRQQIKERFNQEGIEIPYNHMTILDKK